MRCPTFKYHGSKCRMAPWIIDHFPHRIGKYVEPFAGRGNVYYRLCMSDRMFEKAYLNDIKTFKWLKALKEYDGNYDFLPESITKDIYDKFRSMKNCPERTIAEAVLAYNGNFYGRGANITYESANGYNAESSSVRYKNAHRLLQKAILWKRDWKECVESLNLGPQDLLYCDPPYYKANYLIYPQIEHGELLDRLKSMSCKVVLSSYLSTLYKTKLKTWNVDYKIRAATATRQSMKEPKERHVEVLYMNF